MLFTGKSIHYLCVEPQLIFDFRGESGIGKWTLIVKDTEVNDNNGTFVDWHLKLWGEAIDPKLAKLLPMPEETDDDNHADIVTTTITATHTSISIPMSSSSAMAGNPTDHPDRPVNSKPTGTGSSEEQVSATSSSAPVATTTAASGWLPSSFPTFGLSPHTQVWVFGSIGLIAVFCCGLGIYFYMARIKRLRNNPRDTYEFDVLQDEEAEGLTGNGAARKKGKRRAGELYDAFAAGSEDEDEEFSEDDNEKQYRDQESRHVIGDDDEDSEMENDEKSSKQHLVAK